MSYQTNINFTVKRQINNNCELRQKFLSKLLHPIYIYIYIYIYICSNHILKSSSCNLTILFCLTLIMDVVRVKVHYLLHFRLMCRRHHGFCIICMYVVTLVWMIVSTSTSSAHVTFLVLHLLHHLYNS